MEIKALFEQWSGFGGPERAIADTPLPAGLYFCIIPQEDLTITAITLADDNVTETDYAGEDLAKGIPFYIPFLTATLTGGADCYKVKQKWTPIATTEVS